MSGTFHIMQNQLYCVAEQVVETIAVVERHMADDRSSLRAAKSEYTRGYHEGHLNAMKFMWCELERIKWLDGVTGHLAEATANLRTGGTFAGCPTGETGDRRDCNCDRT